MESSLACGCRSASRSSSSRSRRKWGRASSAAAGSGGSVIRPASASPGVPATSLARVGDPLRRDAAALAGEVDLDERRERPTRRGRSSGESRHRASRDDGLDDVGELGDVRRRAALEGSDEVPRGSVDDRSLDPQLLDVVLTHVADAGLDDPADGLRGDRLRRRDEPNVARPASRAIGRASHPLADRRRGSRGPRPGVRPSAERSSTVTAGCGRARSSSEIRRSGAGPPSRGGGRTPLELPRPRPTTVRRGRTA